MTGCCEGTRMSFSPKTTSLQAYNLLLYRNALHPEFFGIEGRSRIQHGLYEFEAWVYQGGHALRFEFGGLCLSEIVTDQVETLPERGLVTTLPCAGERDHEQEFADRILYMTSMQTEMLSDHLYMSTYNELLDHAEVCQGLQTAWLDELDRPNLSLLDMQRYRNEVHVQGYHLRSDCGLVLRTQSIFQQLKGSNGQES
jgi:hypothetical protein